MKIIKNSDVEIQSPSIELPLEFLTRYVPLQCFSHSAISETYLVQSKENSNQYVAKIYDRFFVEESADERVILKQLNHPAVPKLIESIETEEFVCVIRDYEEGTPLDKLNNPVSERAALNIGLQLCDILTYLHTQTPPIIHRDIKPSNVIIDNENKIYLIDFDISRQYDEKAVKDTTLIATDGFSPPEQYGYKQTDTLADIFSFGKLFCWLLTGSNEVAETDGIKNRALARVIQKCAAFAPENRYKTAETVKAALIRACNNNNNLLKNIIIATAAIFVIVGSFMLGRLTAPVLEIVQTETPVQEDTSLVVSESIIFKEPLIEAAVRYTLGLDDSQSISENDLKEIKELFIAGNRVYKDYEDFRNDLWVNQSGEEVSHPLITELSDLSEMPFLEDLAIISQPVADIAPISELRYLQRLNISDNIYITDFSPLKELNFLMNLIIDHTKITDLSALYDLPLLNSLSMNNCVYYNPVQLRELKNIKTLNIMGNAEAHKYISEIELIDLMTNELNSFSDIVSSKQSLVRLHLFDVELSDLSGIEEFTMLEIIRLDFCDIVDFSPLLSLPNLRELQVDETMRQAVEKIKDIAEFEIKIN